MREAEREAREIQGVLRSRGRLRNRERSKGDPGEHVELKTKRGVAPRSML